MLVGRGNSWRLERRCIAGRNRGVALEDDVGHTDCENSSRLPIAGGWRSTQASASSIRTRDALTVQEQEQEELQRQQHGS